MRFYQSLAILVLFAALTILSSCGTMHGIGQDIQSAGQNLQTASDAVSEKMAGEK